MLKPIGHARRIDTQLALADIGWDPMMSTELRIWTKCEFGINVSTLEIMEVVF
jgi:hypothetical protein